MRARPGFSLVELLVAVAILGVLMAGLGQVLAGSMQAFATVREGLELQRTLRWAIQELDGDLRAAGLLFPPPWLRPMPQAAGGGPGLPQACAWWPDQPLRQWSEGALAPLPSGADPLAPAGGTSDVLALVLDRPLPVEGVLAADVPGPGAEGIQVCLDGPCQLEAGDLVWVAGDRFECAVVPAPLVLAGQTPEALPVRPALAPGGPAFLWPHAEGAWVGLVRPLRMVRLAVVYMALAGAGPRVPCLVRFESSYQAPDPMDPWAGLEEGPGTPVVLAERVTALKVDPPLDPAEPLGSGRVPGVIRVHLETRSPGPPVRHARLTWAFRLRNAGVEP